MNDLQVIQEGLHKDFNTEIVIKAYDLIRNDPMVLKHVNGFDEMYLITEEHVHVLNGNWGKKGCECKTFDFDKLKGFQLFRLDSQDAIALLEEKFKPVCVLTFTHLSDTLNVMRKLYEQHVINDPTLDPNVPKRFD